MVVSNKVSGFKILPNHSFTEYIHQNSNVLHTFLAIQKGYLNPKSPNSDVKNWLVLDNFGFHFKVLYAKKYQFRMTKNADFKNLTDLTILCKTVTNYI